MAVTPRVVVTRIAPVAITAALTLGLVPPGSAAAAPAPAPAPAVAAAPQPAVAVGCVPGTWSVNPTFPDAKPLQFQSAHFAFRWTAGAVTQAQAQAGADILEHTYAVFRSTVHWPEPYCDTATKFKVTVQLDPGYGLSGGGTGTRDPGMWIGPGALADRWGLAHEFTHSLQYHSLGLRDSQFTGWFWESHANWMAHQVPENNSNTHCSDLLVGYPHLYYGSTRDRYCNWQFWEYVKNRFGYQAVNDIWTRSPKPGDPGQAAADPMSVLARNKGWTVARLNDVFGDWAMHNVNWDYVNPDGTDHGAVLRARYGANTDLSGYRVRRLTRLDPIDLAKRRFAVPADWAPQRWGYNLVRVHPDAGATAFTVTFRGVTQAAPATTVFGNHANQPAAVPPPSSGWRWGVVTVAADGSSRYSAMKRAPVGTLTVPVLPGDRSHWMVVLGAPTAMQQVFWDQAYYTVYRFPWKIQLGGAMPDGFQPGAPNPTATGHRHPNGGGWVADGASVAATAYVGRYAQVLGGTVSGNARIEDHAVVRSGTVSGSAVVGALSVIDNDTVVGDSARVRTSFFPIGGFEPGVRLTGTAQVIGDVEYRGGADALSGAYYGFVDSGVINDPRQGADRAAAEKEVTAQFPVAWP